MPIRCCAALMSMLLTGCLAVTHHTRHDAFSVPGGMRVEKGKMTVVATDGEQAHFNAPFTAVAHDGAIYIKPDLLPIQSFDAAGVERLDVTAVSPTRTVVQVTIGTLAISAVVGVIAMGFALQGWNLPLKPFPAW